MRCARIAPRTTPIANAPRIPIAATLNVRSSPCRNSEWCTQMKCQLKLARTAMLRRGGAAAHAAAAPSPPLLRAAVRRRVGPDRICEVVLRPRHVVDEARHEARRGVRPQDLGELVALLHVPDRRVHPPRG